MRSASLPSPYRGLLHHAVFAPWMLTCLIAACGAGAAATDQSLRVEPAVDAGAVQTAQQAPVKPSAPTMTPRRIGLDLTAARTRLQGEIFVVKLHDGAGQTYYLGTAGTADSLDLQLLLPHDLASLRMEVFTELSDAGSYQDEIRL